ncbi:hypothetical protein Cpir12675_000909 [Ceratocystis pirilliformis]|uniref:Uncharacterized protein n=1 Tax=Ceratocystis pirilliformis TaxID=259994 RepID=A0ABR3ZJN1_9PEZI
MTFSRKKAGTTPRKTLLQASETAPSLIYCCPKITESECLPPLWEPGKPHSITQERLRQIEAELKDAHDFLAFSRAARHELRGRVAIAKSVTVKELVLLSNSASGATRRRNLREAVDIFSSGIQDRETAWQLHKAELERRRVIIKLKMEEERLSE